MKILVVDDQRSARRVIHQILNTLEGVEITEASSVAEAVAAIEAAPPDLALLDIRLTDEPNDRGGLDILRRMRATHPTVPVVMVTASAEIAEIRAAMRLGAQDYVLKDELSPELLLPIVEGLRERMNLRGEVVRLREKVNRTWGVSAIVGASPAMDRVRQLVRRVADADATVLIRGETGSGKEMVARALHETSSRRDRPFIAINCSALPHSLMESLIFGHERGAFTGAVTRARGQLELAGSGTILLDEIAEMPMELQTKLLRVLEDRRFRPLGAATEVPLTARILAATHANLEKRLAEGRLREDLYYRLNVVVIAVPSLSERVEDIPELLHAFVAEFPRRLRFTEEAVAWMMRRRWPGNVRELRNVVERLSLLADQDLVTPEVLNLLAAERPQAEVQSEINRLAAKILTLPGNVGNKLDVIERAVLALAIRTCSGNKSAAARLVGVERKVLERHWGRLGEDELTETPKPDD